MIGVEMDVRVALDILDAIRETARTSPVRMRTAYRRNVGRLKGRILARLKVAPGRPRYPLRWKSERQRRAYFATNGFGHGIPYQRTGKLLASYDLELIDEPDGAILRLVNTDPKARFVVGDDAQMMHLDTGWIQMADVVSDARVEAEEILIQTWFTIVDVTAGVPR